MNKIAKQHITGAMLTLLILCIAATLRLWNFDFANPHIGRIEGGDDVLKIGQSVDAAKGKPDYNRFRQPRYLIQTSALLLRAAGLTNLRTDADAIWRLTALSMIAYSVLTVLLVHLLARLVTGDPWTARIAALLLAVVPVEVIGSRYFKEDVPLMFFVTLALLTLTALVVTRRPVFYLLSGITIGTALSVKYVAALLVPVFVVAHVLFLRASSSSARAVEKPWIRFAIALLAIPLVFLIFNRDIIAHWQLFIGGLDYQTTAVTSAHADGTVFSFRDFAGLFGIRFAILPGITWPVLAASLAGITCVIRIRNKAALLALFSALLWYIALEFNQARPLTFVARYYHPVIPVLCIAAAIGLRHLSAWLKHRSFGRTTAILVLAVCILTPLVKTILINKTLLYETRERAVVWMLKNLPPGSSLYFVNPHAPALRRPPPHLTARNGHMIAPAQLHALGITHVVLTSFMYDRYTHMSPTSGERARSVKAWIDELSTHGELVRENKPRFACQTFGFHNPVVRIYRIAPPKLPESGSEQRD